MSGFEGRVGYAGAFSCSGWVWWGGNIGGRLVKERGAGQESSRTAACEVNKTPVSNTETNRIFGKP